MIRMVSIRLPKGKRMLIICPSSYLLLGISGWPILRSCFCCCWLPNLFFMAVCTHQSDLFWPVFISLCLSCGVLLRSLRDGRSCPVLRGIPLISGCRVRVSAYADDITVFVFGHKGGEENDCDVRTAGRSQDKFRKLLKCAAGFLKRWCVSTQALPLWSATYSAFSYALTRYISWLW